MNTKQNILDKDLRLNDGQLKPSFREACIELERVVFVNIAKLRSEGKMSEAKYLEHCWHTMKVGA